MRSRLNDLLKNVLQNPRQLGDLLEEQVPWLNETVKREILSAASKLADPYLVGMGVRILNLNEERAEIKLPHNWKNSQNIGGSVHVGALCTVSELASRLLWEKHLPPALTSAQIQRLEANFLRPAVRDVRAICHLPESDREALLFKLRSSSETLFDHTVQVYDSEEQLVAEVSVEWKFRQQASLPAGKKVPGNI